MVDKSELAIATSQTQNPIPFLIELLFNLLSQIITISTIKLTSQPVSKFRLILVLIFVFWFWFSHLQMRIDKAHSKVRASCPRRMYLTKVGTCTLFCWVETRNSTYNSYFPLLSFQKPLDCFNGNRKSRMIKYCF